MCLACTLVEHGSLAIWISLLPPDRSHLSFGESNDQGAPSQGQSSAAGMLSEQLRIDRPENDNLEPLKVLLSWMD
jgi:hypothetical protein